MMRGTTRTRKVVETIQAALPVLANSFFAVLTSLFFLHSCNSCGKYLLKSPFLLNSGYLYCGTECKKRVGPPLLTANLTLQL